MTVLRSFKILSLSLVLVVVALKILCHPCVVSGDSMNPTYYSGQVVFTKTNFEEDDLTYNTVICLRDSTQNKVLIKRIVALPGDSVMIYDGVLYVNGEEVIDDFEAMEYAGIAENEIILGEDEYFVLGDNRNNSRDSRHIGAVSFNNIICIVG